MKRIISALLLLAVCANGFSQRTIDLSGEWAFEIDRKDKGIDEKWQDRNLSDRIVLPASMPERLKGDDINVDTKWVGSLYDSSYFYNPYMKKYRDPKDMKLTFFLTPAKHYVGVAWYNKTVHIDKVDTKRRCYKVFLERPHIKSSLYVNGELVNSDRSLCVPHEYDVTKYIKDGDNLISIRIDNRLETVNVGQDSHSVTDQTQGDWNGIVGKMELREIPYSHITDLQVYPDIDNKKACIDIELSGCEKGKYTLVLKAESFNGAKPHVVTLKEKVVNGYYPQKMSVVLDMGDDMQLWDEFHPCLYRLSASVVESKSKLAKQKDLASIDNDAGVVKTVFGMRKFDIRGKMFYVNNRQIQLRGTVENCDFPLTGYAPMDVDSWVRVFKRCREYGLNHMRFHSYCPPEAAFMAADLVGFYIQPEGPSWPNHGVRLGYGDDIDRFLLEETQRLSKVYGNHPSFCMLACGNEPAGRWVEWVSKFVDYWKQADTRRVYTGASVGGGWAWQPKSQYHVKAGARGLASWQSQSPQTMDDFSRNISHYSAKDMETDIHEPYVSHETGQWCAFPDFSEIPKYTGVNKAKNFEVFRDILNDHGMGKMAERFLMASGYLQALCYKYEIEKTLRTPEYAGFQLLSLNDYSGQGTALVGVTNVFFEDKGYMSGNTFKHFCSPIVPLARIPKFTYKNSETFKAEILLNQFSDHELKNADVCYSVSEVFESVFPFEPLGTSDSQTHSLGIRNYPIGGCQKVGDVEYSLAQYTKPTHLRLKVGIADTDIFNEWDIWVYPDKVESSETGIYVTDNMDSKAWQVLENGGDVLITAGKNVQYGNEVVQYFTPVFWNTSWFKMRPPHTTGIYVENDHSIFTDFPTSYYSDLQWWELVNKAPVMQFDEFPNDFQPLVQSIDTWFLSRKIGMLYEAKVLNGRLVMTTMDITNNLDNRIVARQMRASILNYMHSEKFKPRYDISPDIISDLFTKTAPKVEMYTKGSPDELKPKLK